MYATACEYRAMRRRGLDLGVWRGAWVGWLEEGVCSDFLWGLRCVGKRIGKGVYRRGGRVASNCIRLWQVEEY